MKPSKEEIAMVRLMGSVGKPWEEAVQWFKDRGYTNE